MNKYLKKLLKVVGIYTGYLILIVALFYIFGLYVFNMMPTPLVLTRMIVFPLILTLITIGLAGLIKKYKNGNK